MIKGTVPVVQPNASLIGKDLKDLKDPNGVYLFARLNELAKNGGGFLHYMWAKHQSDGSEVQTEKVAYAVMIPNTDGLWLSTGVYTDDLSHHLSTLMDPIKSKMLYSFWTNLIITFIILLVCSL
ncbi:cache domain-containing protein, partial [Helicobacter sp. 13S00401-1]|uniref:cache domain-containing protein n=1 Tax=Helicobacter sp. 13S00401-1 TaxID=1905758 RepID=UPI0015524418